MVTAPSLPVLILLALAAPPAAAGLELSPPTPVPDGPRLDAAGATPRWDHPLAVRVRLHAPAGDDRPLPPHCLTPTVHYGGWPVPPSQLRWRIEHEPDTRSAWLALESPLRVNEPWIDLTVDWHCGATLARQGLTLLVEPDWPGDEAAPARDAAGPRTADTRAADRTGRFAPVSHVTAHELQDRGPPIDAGAVPWVEWFERLARLESAVSRSATPFPARSRPAASAPAADGTALRPPSDPPVEPPRPAEATEAATAAAEPPASAAVPAAPPARVVTVAADTPAWASPWPWMLASGVLGWAWGRRPRATPSPRPARGDPAGPGTRTRPALERPLVTRRAAAAGSSPETGPRWPAWFGAPTRPDGGRWLTGGLTRPETALGSAVAEPLTPAPVLTETPAWADSPSAVAPAHDVVAPWPQGLLLSEVVHDGADGPADPLVTAPTETAAKAAVPGSCAA